MKKEETNKKKKNAPVSKKKKKVEYVDRETYEEDLQLISDIVDKLPPLFKSDYEEIKKLDMALEDLQRYHDNLDNRLSPLELKHSVLVDYVEDLKKRNDFLLGVSIISFALSAITLFSIMVS